MQADWEGNGKGQEVTSIIDSYYAIFHLNFRNCYLQSKRAQVRNSKVGEKH